MKKRWSLILLAVMLLVVLVGCGESAEDVVGSAVSAQPTQTATPEMSEEPSEAPEAKGYAVGEAASLKNVEVTLVSVTESEGSDFFEPEEGNVFVICEFDIANQSKEELSISSILSFDAYCDDYACSYSLSAQMASDKSQLDGAVAVGKKMNGVIGYEVPSDWKELEIHFSPNVWSGKDLMFIATHE